MSRAALALGLLLAASQAHAQDYVSVPVAEVTFGMTEEEGGSALYMYLPSGWMLFKGHKSCCGYRPPLADGWYKLSPADAQAFFDGVARAIALGRTEKQGDRDVGSHCEITFPDGKKTGCRGFLPVGGAAKPTAATAPREARQIVYVGRHLRSMAVLRLLEHETTDASGLTAGEVDQLLAAIAADPSRDVARGERWERILGTLPDAATPKIAALLARSTGARPPSLSPAAVLRVLGAHGAASRSQIAAIRGAAVDDATTAAAALALWQVGGDDALAALRALLPTLGQPPREQNLQMFYRFEFARVLRRIALPEARAILDDKIFPVVRAHLEAAGPNAMNDAGVALDVWRGDAKASILDAAYTKLFVQLLRSPKSDDRWMAAERLHHRYGGDLPAPLRRALEERRTDPDPTVRNWVEQALKRN